MHYYCHDCGVISGTLRPIDPVKLTGSKYQLGKFLKHTTPCSLADYNTVFTSSAASEAYLNYVVTTVASGHIQVDDQNRVNVIWVASRDIGVGLQGGSFVGPTDAVKVVLHDKPHKIHAFPINSSKLKAASCARCGRTIPY
jgi:hypothetical protein